MVSLTIGRKDIRSQYSAPNGFVASHFATTNESQYQARVAEFLERDFKRECSVEDWMPVTVGSGSALCLDFIS